MDRKEDPESRAVGLGRRPPLVRKTRKTGKSSRQELFPVPFPRALKTSKTRPLPQEQTGTKRNMFLFVPPSPTAGGVVTSRKNSSKKL